MKRNIYGRKTEEQTMWKEEIKAAPEHPMIKSSMYSD